MYVTTHPRNKLRNSLDEQNSRDIYPCKLRDQVNSCPLAARRIDIFLGHSVTETILY